MSTIMMRLSNGLALLLAVALVSESLQVEGGGSEFPDRSQAAEKPAAKSLPVRIFQPQKFAGSPVPAVRTPLGIPEDYKPWITKLKNNQLLIVCFHAGRNPMKEHAVFWRSDDGGKTWSKREPRPDVAGREFSLTCLSDGTLLMPCHFLSSDSVNKAGHTYSKVFRSVDRGKTWTETRVGPEGFPAMAATMNDWTAFEVSDPKRPGKQLTCLGTSMSHGGKQAPGHVFLWRSRDSGKTWDKSLNPNTQGWSDVDGFFCQSVTYAGQRNRLLHVVRVDRGGPHWKLPVRPGETLAGNDNADRMMLWLSTDAGHSWHKQKEGGRFGIYGEMYPRFLKLADKRLLLTFTVRSGSTDGYPLGVRAIVSDDDGENWDFRRDRLVISYENQGASGGGFGNTVQNADGSLVSCYSYRGQDGKTHVEAVRWQLPALKK
ncbi:MAG TPA: hypothetical protein EYN03_05105 [Planctomycetes bacterium]|nr:hypothetical protein [Planctomycetota bacterium]